MIDFCFVQFDRDAILVPLISESMKYELLECELRVVQPPRAMPTAHCVRNTSNVFCYSYGIVVSSECSKLSAAASIRHARIDAYLVSFIFLSFLPKSVESKSLSGVLWCNQRMFVTFLLIAFSLLARCRCGIVQGGYYMY